MNLKILKSSLKSSFWQNKLKVVTNCENEYFKLTKEIEEVKSWDKKEKLIDERHKLIKDCLNKLSVMDSEYMKEIPK